ncbi:MAG: hypothetical protein VX723_04065 [Candidatus Thermoplasmatota archaeon]|nr:hypothetical protein [Candidatus Thermoplasmatota archaeon]
MIEIKAMNPNKSHKRIARIVGAHGLKPQIEKADSIALWMKNHQRSPRLPNRIVRKEKELGIIKLGSVLSQRKSPKKSRNPARLTSLLAI